MKVQHCKVSNIVHLQLRPETIEETTALDSFLADLPTSYFEVVQKVLVNGPGIDIMVQTSAPINREEVDVTRLK